MINLNNKIKSPKLKKGGNKKKRKSPFSEKYKKFLNNENVDELISPQIQDTSSPNISPNISPDIKINVIKKPQEIITPKELPKQVVTVENVEKEEKEEKKLKSSKKEKKLKSSKKKKKSKSSKKRSKKKKSSKRKKKKEKKRKSLSNKEMISELSKKGIQINKKNPKLIEDIYMLTKDDYIKIHKEK